MFLHLLNEQQKKTFLLVAKKFIICDSKITLEEENLVDLLIREMNIKPNITNLENYDLVSVSKIFSDSRSKVIVLLEIINLGYADREYADVEKSFVSELATSLEVDKSELKKIEEWVLKNRKLNDEIELIHKSIMKKMISK